MDRRGRKNMIIFINIYFLGRVREREREKWALEGDIVYNYIYKDLLFNGELKRYSSGQGRDIENNHIQNFPILNSFKYSSITYVLLRNRLDLLYPRY